MIFAQPQFNQFCLAVYCVLGVFAGSSTTVCAHVYEDGFVERSLTITIRDGIGYGEYQIGLNEKTARQILELAEQLKIKNAQTESTKELPNAAGDHGGLQSPLPAPLTKPEQAEDSSGAAESAIESKLSAAESRAEPQKLRAVGSGEHLTDPAAIKLFGELQQEWFTDHLKLSSDGQAVELSKVLVEPAARHPYSVLVKFQFSLHKNDANETKLVAGEPDVATKSVPAANRVIDFQVTDGVFSGFAGATRYALRGRGATMLLQSNVAPILVRAERVEVDSETAVKKISSPTVKAKLTVGRR